MRKTQTLFAAAGAALIGFASFSQAAPAANSPPPSASADKAGNTAGPQAKSPAGQQQRPFYCFGDAACEREMDRLGRPVADRAKKQNDSEGPYINGIPGQTDGPGFGNAPIPVVPGK